MQKLQRLLVVAEPGRDGVFDYTAAFVDHLARRHPEVAVDLAYSSRRSSPGLPGLVERVRARGGQAVDLQVGNAPEPRDFPAALRLLRLARHAQAVAAQSSKAGALCRLLRLLCPGFPPVLYLPHAYYGLGGDLSRKTRFYNAVEAALGRVGRTVTISPDERRFALQTLRLPPERVEMVLMNVDTARYRPAPPGARERGRERFGLPAGARVLVTVGRHSAQKNYPPLYRALGPLLADPARDLFFVHAGAGGEELGRLLPEAARPRFVAAGHVDQVEELLWAADAFILTSRYEGLALSVLSALCCGLKLFLTRAPGNRCLAELGFDGIGWIEPSSDETELAARIGAVLRPWLENPQPEGAPAGQVERARILFDAEARHEEVFHLLEGLAR